MEESKAESLLAQEENADNPIAQTTSIASTKSNKIVPLLIVLLILALATATLFAYQNFQLSRKIGQLQVLDQSQFSSPAPIIQETSPTTLPAFLSTNCNTEDTIELDKLPFILNQDVVNKYEITTTVPCHWGFSGERMNGYIRLENRQGSLPTSTLKIGSAESEDGYFGEEDFVNFENIIPTMVVDDLRIVIDIEQPGPYGVDSNGIWLEARAYKKVGDYLIIAKDFSVIEVEGELKSLMMEYADEKSPNSDLPEGFPEYTVNQKYSEFKQSFIDKYFSEYPNIQDDYKAMVEGVVSDANGVSLSQ